MTNMHGIVTVSSTMCKLAEARCPYPDGHWQHDEWLRGFKGLKFNGSEGTIAVEVWAEGAADRQRISVKQPITGPHWSE